MVSTLLRIRIPGFSLNPEIIKRESLRDFSESLETNARIITPATIKMCLSVLYQIQHSSTILKFDAISTDTLTEQKPINDKKRRIRICFAPFNISLYASYHQPILYICSAHIYVNYPNNVQTACYSTGGQRDVAVTLLTSDSHSVLFRG
jgi:hypothetical protein